MIRNYSILYKQKYVTNFPIFKINYFGSKILYRQNLLFIFDLFLYKKSSALPLYHVSGLLYICMMNRSLYA